MGVTAHSYWTASRASETLKIIWPGGQTDLYLAIIRARQVTDLDTGRFEDTNVNGDAAEALAPVTVPKAEYEVPNLANATMQPMNCTVFLKRGRADIRVAHQNQLFARHAAAERLGLDTSRATMHPVHPGTAAADAVFLISRGWARARPNRQAHRSTRSGRARPIWPTTTIGMTAQGQKDPRHTPDAAAIGPDALVVMARI